SSKLASVRRSISASAAAITSSALWFLASLKNCARALSMSTPCSFLRRADPAPISRSYHAARGSAGSDRLPPDERRADHRPHLARTGVLDPVEQQVRGEAAHAHHVHAH